MIAKQIQVYGRVQGVGFRYYVYRHAKVLGINGFVRNEPDGSVYIEAEAENEQDMEEFINYVRKGPALARVDMVNVVDKPPVGYKGFEIR